MSEKIRDVNIKLTAKEDVHIRENAPELKNGNKKGVIHKGFTVDFVEEWQGDTYPDTSNNKWYRDKNGDFLWSGGFEEAQAEIPTGELKLAQNYNRSFTQIPESYRRTKGKGVKVVVIDSGVQVTHDVFLGSIKDTYCTLDDSKSVIDTNNHGTHITGLIGARNTTIENGFIGVAPNCDLYVCKVTNDGNVSVENFKKALNWAINSVKAHVINMSFRIKDENQSFDDDEIEALLTKLDDQNIIGIASANNDDLLSEDFKKHYFYPARHSKLISVGCLSKDAFSRLKNQLSEFNDFIMPFKDIYSCINENGKYDFMSGSSMSTGLISGVASLIISKDGRMNSASFREILKDIAAPLSNSSFEDKPLKIYQHEKS